MRKLRPPKVKGSRTQKNKPMISRAWGSTPITFKITQNKNTYDENINKCFDHK